MDSLSARLATSADAPQIVSLRGVWDEEKGGAAGGDFAEGLAEWMDAHASHICALAFAGDTPIGMAWLAVVERVPRPDNFTRRSGDIQSVFVLPAFRRHGVGAAMMSALDEAAESLGLVHLSVHSSTAGIPLYESVGFGATPLLMRKPRAAGL